MGRTVTACPTIVSYEPVDVPPLDASLVDYFDRGQTRD
jgi:hypothetical protein